MSLRSHLGDMMLILHCRSRGPWWRLRSARRRWEHANATSRPAQNYSGSASGHSLQHVLDISSSLALLDLISRRAWILCPRQCCRGPPTEAASTAHTCNLTPCFGKRSLVVLVRVLGFRQELACQTSRRSKMKEIWGKGLPGGYKTAQMKDVE